MLQNERSVGRWTWSLDHGPARERLLDAEGRYADAVAERERAPARGDAHAHRAALDCGEAAYRALLQDEMRREAEALEQDLRVGEPMSPDELFSPAAVRLVQLYARLGNWKRARSRQLEAQAARPVLARWFASLPELADQRIRSGT